MEREIKLQKSIKKRKKDISDCEKSLAKEVKELQSLKLARINAAGPKIKRYQMKQGVTEKDLEAFRITKSDNESFYGFRKLKDSIEIYFKFESIEGFDDYESLTVLDDDFGQPYTPFYHALSGVEVSEYCLAVVEQYNTVMDGLSFLEEKEKCY